MKNNSLRKLLTLFMIFFIGFSYSQGITGKVSSADGPLPGVSVMVKGSTSGTQTDLDGLYNIQGANKTDILVFSYIGFKSHEIQVAGKSTLNVVLKDEQNELKEIIVVGYGSVKKKDATTAIETLKSESFNKGISTSPEQLLQGKIAGVQVTSGSGEPGAANSVRIRGISSIRAGSDPLYVIDGVPIGGGDVSAGTSNFGMGEQSARNPLNFINPSDIASIDILKDASATAIYGSRGANGVIIITTKKGKKGAGQMTFNMSNTISTISHDYNLLTASEFRAASPQNDKGSNVDAFKSILRTALTKSYDLGYSGGSENGTYRFSLGYLNQEGIIKNSGLEKYNASINITQKILDNRVTLESSLITSLIKDQAPPLSNDAGSEGDLIISALKWNPTLSLYNPDGSLTIAENSEFNKNPQNLLQYYTDRTETIRVLGNMAATVNIAKGLDYKVSLGVDYSDSNRGVGYSSLIEANRISNPNTPGMGGAASKSTVIRSNYVIENTLNYNTDLSDKFKLNALVGYSFQKFENKGNTFIGTGFGKYTDQNYYLKNITAARQYATSGNFAQLAYFDPSNKLQSFFGRAGIAYDDKYILSGIIRADGSSKFGERNKYGYFPAASFAWKINKENFAPKFFDDLKLRLGWGITGNQDFPAGAASTLVGPIEGVPTIVNNGNKNLKWESTTQYNIGIDFAILNNRLRGSADVYTKETNNPLLQVLVPVPALYSQAWSNLPNTKITSKGIEFAVNYKIVNQDTFSWDFGANFSFNDSNIKGLDKDGYPTGITTGVLSGPGLGGNSQGHYNGQELYQFYLLQFEGFDANGISKYADLNHDGQINDKDKAYSGSANPNFNIGLNTTLRYKSWDLIANGYGSYGRKLYDNTENAIFNARALTFGNNVPQYVLNNGESPTENSNAPSTRYLQSGDFFRLANVTLGYTLQGGKEGFLQWIKSMRVYATVSNIFVITPYKGFDPEVNSNKSVNGIPSSGIDYSSYPKARSFSLGLNFNL